MSVILGDYNKKKKPDISIDGYVQSLPPDGDIPPSWAAHENRIFSEKKRLGEILLIFYLREFFYLPAVLSHGPVW